MSRRLKNACKIIVIIVFFGIWEFMSRMEILNPDSTAITPVKNR